MPASDPPHRGRLRGVPHLTRRVHTAHRRCAPPCERPACYPSVTPHDGDGENGQPYAGPLQVKVHRFQPGGYLDTSFTALPSSRASMQA
eukprot:4596408-Pyramimonas_sp.AAC.1